MRRSAVRKTSLLTAILSLRLALRAGAQTPPAVPPLPAVGPLIEQLGDSDFRKRDEASRRLEALGARVVPALRQALGHPDTEVRRRLRELIPAIETAALLAPRRVTLHLT